MTAAPPGWYPDPASGGGWRYWDGQSWTDQSEQAGKPAPTAPPPGWEQPASSTPRKGGARVAFIARMVALVLAAFVASQIAGIAFGAFSYMMPLGDPGEDTDWSTQPLEIVADAEKRACVLNVSAVAPGRHETLVIAVGTPARVLIKDPAGEVVLQASDEADSKAEAAPSVRLREMGTYRVECHNNGRATTTAQLTVTSADEAAEWSN